MSTRRRRRSGKPRGNRGGRGSEKQDSMSKPRRWARMLLSAHSPGKGGAWEERGGISARQALFRSFSRSALPYPALLSSTLSRASSPHCSPPHRTEARPGIHKSPTHPHPTEDSVKSLFCTGKVHCHRLHNGYNYQPSPPLCQLDSIRL